MTAESAPEILESSNSAPPKVDKLKAAKGFIFDMDGVLYRGKQPLPGVQTLFDALTLRGIKFLLATNNSTALPSDYVKRMAEMNVTVTENDVQTSATATRDYLRDELPAGAKIYIVGMPALAHLMFDGTGFEQATDETPANEVTAVVAGLDFEFTYTKLRTAMAAVHAGAKFIATNADATLPHEGGFWPGSGSLIAAIATASGTQPIVVGKPEPLMMQKGIELLGLSADEVVMVGDRLDTDILAGYRAGTTTALVLTGVTTRDDLASATPLPDYVFADLPALTQEIVGHG
ncbi:MAG: HAD-IIA family hydrolase [Thermomicrobiales bacterium]